MSKTTDQDAVEEFKSLDMHLTKALLLSILSTRTKKRSSSSPKNGTFDNRAGNDFENHESQLSTKLQHLQSVISILGSLQSDRIDGTINSTKLKIGAISHMDSRGGLSQNSHSVLAKAGVAPSHRYVRDLIHRLNSVLVFEDVLPSPPANYNYQAAITFDNADFRLYANCVNLIVSAQIGIGLEKDADTKLINEQFMSGLPIPTTDMLKDIIPNKHDDAEAQKYDDYQSLYTLQCALMICIHEEDDDAGMAQDGVTSSSSNGDDEDTPSSNWSEEDIKGLHQRSQEFIVGKDDGARRSKTKAPMLSGINDVIQGASSKSSELLM